MGSEFTDVKEGLKRLENQVQALSDKVDKMIEIRISITELSAQVSSNAAIIQRVEESNKERGSRLGAIETSFREKIAELRGELKHDIDVLKHKPAEQVASRVSTAVTQVIGLLIACVVGLVISKITGK